MTSENHDPFDGASPNTSHLHEPDSYDDLLGVQVPIEALDLPMPEFQGELDQPTSAIDGESIRDITMENSIAEAIAHRKDTDTDTLRDSAAESCKILVSKSRSKPSIIPARHEAARNHLRDESSPSNDFISDRVVELLDAEDNVFIKDEDDEDPFNWTGMPDTISISDDDDDDDGEDDDILILQPDGSSVPIKKEDDEVEFIWEKMGDHVIDLDSDSEPSVASKLNLGKSFLKGLDPKGRRPPIDRSGAMRAQEAYLRALRRKRGIAEPSMNVRSSPHLGVINGLGLQEPKRSDLPLDDDESAWMNADYTPDEDTGRNFRALKKSYNAKVKRDNNTLDDDIEFVKAEKAENLRLARLKAEYEDARGYSDDDKSDDGLFVSPSLAKSSCSKRRAADDPDPDDENPDPRSPKQRKPNSSHKRTQQELDQEQDMNMMTGIDGFLRKLKGKSHAKGENSVKGKGKYGEKAKAGKKSGPRRTKRKPNEAGYLNNSSSLLTSSVYEDADANLDREALPVSGHTHKQKALAALVASVPLGTTSKDAAAEKNHIKKSTVTLGRGVKGGCRADGFNNWKLAGMKSSLHHHQVQGAAFMKDRETGGEEPLGGILADAMGLGKTLMTIALMISNPPPHNEKYRATLIVCSPGLLVQWEREIETHTEDGHLDDVLKHRSGERTSGKAAIRVLQEQDVILTTYQEVAKSYPKLSKPEDVHGEEEVKAWWGKHWNQERDMLHQIQFYRIILDESQVIKNHETQTSKACRALMAKHRWTLSATPISNRVDELYPYFKFLRVPYTGSFSDFQDNYCQPGSDDCNSRLHCLLDQVMCRRTLKDTILGAPIVKLPKHNQRSISIEFSPVEKAIYRLVFKKFVGILNKASAEGNLEKHPGLGLVAFLRLRQMCAHTFLVQEVLEELLDLEMIDNIKDTFIVGATPENKNDRDLIAALRRMIEAKPQVVEEEPEEPEQVQPGKLAAKFGSCLKTLKAKSDWAELKTRTLCHSCGEPPESAMVTSCLHVYCQECLQGMANTASANDQDETACLECGVVFTGAEPCAALKELEWDDYWLLNETAGRKKRPTKVNMEWVAYENKIVMSAKITAVRKQVEKWLEEEPDKKIIIFSQFHMIMQILEKICQKKFSYCTYHGKMSHKARDKVLTEFAKDDDMKIMIASLKCGGIGLNLTMASKVICIDLWFNSCMEQQAFCRVFRIGQESETFITRFIVNKSADDKLMDMQLKKNALIGRAIDDKSVLSKLTTHDILRLFGEVKFDQNKRPFIHLDDDEKLDSLFEKHNEH